MPVEIFNKNQQASGSFNNGEILKNELKEKEFQIK